MRAREAIDLVDEVRPNAFSREAKLRWLNALEGRLASEVFLMAPAEIASCLCPAGQADDWTLLVDAPYDDLYPLWLGAKIDEANGEYNKYENTMQAFNAHYGSFVRWFAGTYEPVQGYEEEFS